MNVLHTNTNGYERGHRRVNQLEGFNSVITSVWMGRAYNGVGHQQASTFAFRSVQPPRAELRRLSVARSRRGGHQFGDVGVQCDESAVEGGEGAPVGPRQLGEVGVGHLTVPDDSSECEIGERDTVGPELVS